MRLVSDASIGYLFLGGLVPGLMLGIGFMVMNSFIARRRNYPVEPPIPLREMPQITLSAFPALMLPVILLFGIYGGVMTPTEGAAAAAFYALFASTVLYRAVTWKQLYDGHSDQRQGDDIDRHADRRRAGLQLRRDDREHSGLARPFHAGLSLSAGGFLLLVNVILLVLGCLLEGSTILLVIVPIFIPTAKALGIDLVHFGVVVVVNIMIGLADAALRPVALRRRQHDQATAWPRSCARPRHSSSCRYLVLALITAVPDVVLWLPRLLGYKG